MREHARYRVAQEAFEKFGFKLLVSCCESKQLSDNEKLKVIGGLCEALEKATCRVLDLQQKVGLP